MARIGAASIDWNGDQVEAMVEQAIVDGLEAAGQALVDKYRRLLDTPYPPASRPGQPPHRRSGQLRDDQSHRVARDSEGVSLIVGVAASAPSAEYASFLAKGTKNMKPRPWIDEAEVEAAAAVVLATAEQSMAAATK